MAQAKYITVAELVETLDTRIIGELTSDSGSATTVNESNAPALNAIERASGLVEAAAVKLVRSKGPDILARVAKTHFKTTVRVLAAAGVDRLV